ncbi:hypothetical protein [Pyrococcus yayanosii]|uniref:hypothetical protein n=1 Tax=Pyrococcus yayanosii TaxID=1008460 RepID=UPI0011D24CAB|nr:hypothetical protein [Pyrococcus yayanosii]
MVILLTMVVFSAIALALFVKDFYPKKTAGPLADVGSFNATSLIVRDIVGNVRVVEGNISHILVKSNLPVNATLSGATLRIYCPVRGGKNVCSEYRNGTIVIVVGGPLETVKIEDVVGDAVVSADVKNIWVEDLVGEFWGDVWTSYTIKNVVGNLVVHAGGDAIVEDVVGNVVVELPAGVGVSLSIEHVLGKVLNSVGEGNATVSVYLSNIVGEISIER